MSIQSDIDSAIGKVSVFNLALNVAGIINNQKNVALYIIDEESGKPINILEGNIGRFSGVVNFVSQIDDSGIVMSADIVENSKLAEHPLENGKVLADNKVKLPTEINVRITLQSQDYKDRLAQLKKYRDDNVMISVGTKFGWYDNMQIVSIPCELNVENVSNVTFTLKLREALIAKKTLEVKTAGVADSDTYNIGEVTGNGQVLNLTNFVE